jgi:hypothetical protein
MTENNAESLVEIMLKREATRPHPKWLPSSSTLHLLVTDILSMDFQNQISINPKKIKMIFVKHFIDFYQTKEK